MRKLLVLSLLSASSSVIAQDTKTTPDLVQLQGTYNASIEQVQQSVVNMYVPDGGVAVIDITGQDRFLSYTKNTNQMGVEIKSSGKTVAIKSDVNDGDTYPLSIETLCGRSVSVNIIGLTSEVTPDKIKPKLLISASSC